MKYIIFKRKGLLMPVVFPDFITHSSVMIIEEKEKQVEAISAGFWNPQTGEAFGESESMNLKSNPSIDGALCNMAYLQYPVSEFIDIGYYEKDPSEVEDPGDPCHE